MALASAQVVVLDVTAAHLIALPGSHQENSMNPPQLRQLSFAALMSTLVLVVGCQTAPVQEMSDARQAISAARDAGAFRAFVAKTPVVVPLGELLQGSHTWRSGGALAPCPVQAEVNRSLGLSDERFMKYTNKEVE